MRERGYMLSCHRCGRKEFVPKDRLETWKGLVLKQYGDEPLDICPSCSALFDKLAGYFISSYESGIRMYLEDGTPIMFTPTISEPDKKVESKESTEQKTTYTTSGTTFKMAYLTSLEDRPDLLNKKFVIGPKKDEEDDDE